jgi:hypothetical protein
MFKTALLALALTASATIAHATIQITGRYDAWITFAGTASDGRAICGASIHGDDRNFDIKYTSGTMFIHLSKRGWKIPEGKRVTFTMQVDQAAVWNLNATGHSGTPDFIEFDFDLNETAPSGEKTVVEFTNLIMNGLNVRFQFPNGSESDWIASLRGATPALNKMAVCMKVLDTPPTQPFSG